MFTLRYKNRSRAKFKKMERAGLDEMFYYYSACLHLGKTKDERKLQYSRSNILGFINTGYFTTNNVPDGIIVIYTISGIKAILQDSSVKIADDEGVSPSSSVITRVSCNML
jgi:hypothetical protein